MLPIRPILVAAVATFLPWEDAAAQEARAAGAIEGVVTVEAVPARRTANRYPGGPTQAHALQSLPVLVYLVGRTGDASAGAAARAVMTQQDTAFVPTVVAVRTGGTVSFPNADPFFHNVFSYSSAQRFDLGRYPQGESKDVTFPQPGIVEVFCEVHEFMRAAILVTENPHYALVGDDGRFRLNGVAPGTYTLAVWHPDYAAVERRVEVSAGGTARVEVDLRR